MAFHIKTKHHDGLAFDTYIGDHTVRMDASTTAGGRDSGPSPKSLLLGTLASCSGIDVSSLLDKMRVPYSDFEIVVEADVTEEHPKVFSEITMIYYIKVDPSQEHKVEKAVKMSQEKYCGISEMLRKNSSIQYRIEYTQSAV